MSFKKKTEETKIKSELNIEELCLVIDKLKKATHSVHIEESE